METAPTFIEVLLRPTLGQSDEPYLNLTFQINMEDVQPTLFFHIV